MKRLTLVLLGLTLCSFAAEETLQIDGTDDFVLKDRNNENGIYDTTYKTSDDNHRLSAIYRTNSDTSKLSSLSAYEFAYAKKMETFWFELFYARTSGRFDALGENNSRVLQTNEDSEASNVTLNTFGLGLSYRSKIIQTVLADIINTERVFETTSAAATYNSFSDSYYEKSFTGYGMRADYGIHYRINPNVHWGPHFSYNLAIVKKPAEEGITNSENRSLLLSWTTWGFDLSIYF